MVRPVASASARISIGPYCMDSGSLCFAFGGVLTLRGFNPVGVFNPTWGVWGVVWTGRLNGVEGGLNVGLDRCHLQPPLRTGARAILFYDDNLSILKTCLRFGYPLQRNALGLIFQRHELRCAILPALRPYLRAALAQLFQHNKECRFVGFVPVSQQVNGPLAFQADCSILHSAKFDSGGFRAVVRFLAR